MSTATADLKSITSVKFYSRSEFSKNIKSYNMAVTAVMNRNLSQALRDAHTTIDSLNRSQQSTYKTMCKVRLSLLTSFTLYHKVR